MALPVYHPLAIDKKHAAWKSTSKAENKIRKSGWLMLASVRQPLFGPPAILSKRQPPVLGRRRQQQQADDCIFLLTNQITSFYIEESSPPAVPSAWWKNRHSSSKFFATNHRDKSSGYSAFSKSLHTIPFASHYNLLSLSPHGGRRQ